ncbi:MAG: ATP:cob(I)alamin adenosyltransferase, partial [Gemmatimonadetes bacterium]|nr:ATP:cob(I)alamin adenosyltransferase [Gemmatimonadota bacterium]
MRIYTRTGDDGDTSLIGGVRVPKSHARVEAYGTVDELNSAIGVALTQMRDAPSADRLARVQHDLFAIGAILATPPDELGRRAAPPLPSGRIAEMESWIDEAARELGDLR